MMQNIDTQKTTLKTENFSLHYGDMQALQNINMSVPEHKVTAIIGPSGCGKSSLLRSFNRIHDFTASVKYSGAIYWNNKNIFDDDFDVINLRRKVGMLFQRPIPFPISIFENVAFGIRIAGIKDKEYIQHSVESALKAAGLWEETCDRLSQSALALSGGQQQRLVLARALAVKPEVLLLDEPASALDPRSTKRLEELILQLQQEYTILIVTHNLQQASRISEYTAFLYEGKLVEFGQTSKIFVAPSDKKTEEYISGKFG